MRARAAVLVALLVIAVGAPVAAAPGRATAPPPTVDRDELLYTRSSGESSAITVLRADGSAVRTLTPDGSSDALATWSPDGSRIAFTRSVRAGGQPAYDGIWVMAADGTRARRVVAPDGTPTDPAWSPDGRRLAFDHADLGGSGPPGLDVVDVDGKNRRVVVGIEAQYPQWSPDGHRIAFLSGVTVMVINEDGSNLVPVSPPSVVASAPAWSPDGRRLTFNVLYPTTILADSGWRIAVAEPQALSARPLVDVPSDGSVARWSPDGRRLLYVRLSLSVANADGTDPHSIDRTATYGVYSPAWSADGRRVAFARWGFANGLFVVDANGGLPRLIAPSNSPFLSIEWRPRAR